MRTGRLLLFNSPCSIRCSPEVHWIARLLRQGFQSGTARGQRPHMASPTNVRSFAAGAQGTAAAMSPPPPLAATCRASAVRRALLVFDFDWTLIEENSDTYVIRELGADPFYKAGREAGVPWTQLMDLVLLEAAQKLGRSPADVTAALRSTPLHPAVAGMLRSVAAGAGAGAGAASGSTSGGGGGSSGGGSGSGEGPEVDVVIVSDANTVYIETILQHHGLHHLVAEVHSNPAEWQGGALRVGPYHTHPHGCPHCPSNLCKGQVLTDFLGRQQAAGRQYSHVVYAGDGRGDFCPSALLLHKRWWEAPAQAHALGPAAADAATAADTAAAASDSVSTSRAGGGGMQPQPPPAAVSVLARQEYPDGLPCSLWVMLRTEAGAAGAPGTTSSSQEAGDGSGDGGSGNGGSGLLPAVRVVPWTTPEQLAALVLEELNKLG